MFRYSLLFALILLSSATMAQIRRALNAIEKLKYDQAEEVLYKLLSKDSINTGEKYVFSLLFFTEDYYNYSIDSAYSYALSSIIDYERSDDKAIEKLSKDKITKKDLIEQKNKIEQFAFKLAKKSNSEESYIKYLRKYSTSVLVDSAILFRNSVAYKNAMETNTWKSYESFMTRYPEAIQFSEAKTNYENLIYKDKTKSKQLASYEDFLTEHPETPYRKEIEKSIFDIWTGPHTVERYLSFINKYPESQLNKISAAQIYHILRSWNPSSDYPNIIYQYLDLDSLKRLEAEESHVLFTILENSRYALMDSKGVKRIELNADRVPPDYLCGGIDDQLILSLTKESASIINRLGNVIYTNNQLEEILYSDFGFVVAEQNGKSGIVSISGEVVLPFIAEEVKIIHGQYAAYSVNDIWGIVSINKIVVIEPKYSEIDEFGSLIRLHSSNNKFALIKPEDLTPFLDKEEVIPEFKYDEIEQLANGLILTYSGENQGLITQDLQIVVQEEVQELIQLEKGLIVEKNDGFLFVSEKMDISPALLWKNVDFNLEWIALQGPNGWILVSNPVEKVVEEHIDSVRLLNRSYALTYKNGERSLYFLSGNNLKLRGSSRIEVITSPPVEGIQPAYYILLKEKSSKWLLNSLGDTLVSGNFSDIKAFGNEYLVITERKGSGLLDSSGNRLLPSEFDGIANYSGGSVTLLKDGKLGFYRLVDTTYIPPVYGKSVQLYNDTLFIAFKSGGYGLVNSSNSALSGFAFDEISYFNDSISWVKKDGLWSLYDFINDTYLEKNVISYNTLNNTSGNYSSYQTTNGLGILNNKTGTIINATFSEITNVGSYEIPVFMASKYFEEAEYNVIVYYNAAGTVIYRQAYPGEIFENLVCE